MGWVTAYVLAKKYADTKVVQPDNETLEAVDGILRVKDGGITPSKLSFGTWEKIADVTLSSVSSVSITGLDGDTDKMYRIVIYGKVTVTTYPEWILLKPNGTTISTECILFHRRWDGPNASASTNVTHTTQDGFVLLKYFRSDLSSSAGAVFVDAVLNAQTGFPRVCLSNAFNDDSSSEARYFHFDIASEWYDTTTNITSFDISLTAGTLDGRLLVFKVL